MIQEHTRKRRALVFGTFDHLHPGHLFVLREAQKQGELFVVVARDATVQRIKGRLPDESENVRLQAVRYAVPTAHVLLGSAKDYTEPLRTVQPDIILLGYDQELPPGVLQQDLPCSVIRLSAYEPKLYKSSLRRTTPTEGSS